MWVPRTCRLACHGHSPSVALVPPTMRLENCLRPQSVTQTVSTQYWWLFSCFNAHFSWITGTILRLINQGNMSKLYYSENSALFFSFSHHIVSHQKHQDSQSQNHTQDLVSLDTFHQHKYRSYLYTPHLNIQSHRHIHVQTSGQCLPSMGAQHDSLQVRYTAQPL